jgi:hypothetical protein
MRKVSALSDGLALLRLRQVPPLSTDMRTSSGPTGCRSNASGARSVVASEAL